MEEYECHIMDTRPGYAGHALCGEKILDFAFCHIDHAYMNYKAGGRLMACPDCIAEIKETFDNPL